jgi:hypothetical protein
MTMRFPTSNRPPPIASIRRLQAAADVRTALSVDQIAEAARDAAGADYIDPGTMQLVAINAAVAIGASEGERQRAQRLAAGLRRQVDELQARIAQLEAELRQERSDNRALTAVAARPVRSRTKVKRDAAGEIAVTSTEYE